MVAKHRKYKLMLRTLTAERDEYQTKANTMVQELNEQMTTLQAFAMGRIEKLEKDLITERRRSEDLEKSNELLCSRVEMLEKQILQQQQRYKERDTPQNHSNILSIISSPMNRSTTSMTSLMSEDDDITEVQSELGNTLNTTLKKTSAASDGGLFDLNEYSIENEDNNNIF